MATASIATIIYGFLIASGGIMGFVKAKSIMSIITGGISGVILMVAGFAMGNGKSWALPTTYGITLLLLAFFARRFMHTHKMMPAGMTIGLCIVELIVLVATTRKA